MEEQPVSHSRGPPWGAEQVLATWLLEPKAGAPRSAGTPRGPRSRYPGKSPRDPGVWAEVGWGARKGGMPTMLHHQPARAHLRPLPPQPPPGPASQALMALPAALWV